MSTTTNPTKQGSLLDGAQEQKPAKSTEVAPPEPQQDTPQEQLPAKKEKKAEEPYTGPPVVAGFDTERGFNLMQRAAKPFAESSLVPKAYVGNIGNCMIALNMARRMNADPLQIMQNLYVVHGNPTFSAKFLTATFNACGRYESIKYRFDVDQKTGEKTGCVAYAREKASGDIIEGPKVTLAMAKAEGWSTKPGSKWITMPEVMLMYRAATLMIRAYAPELSMGLSSTEEAVDDVSYQEVSSRSGTSVDLGPGQTLIRGPRPSRISDEALERAMKVVKAGAKPEKIIENIELDLGAPLAEDQRDTIQSAQ